MREIDTRPRIAHGHEDACLVLLGADQQLSCPVCLLEGKLQQTSIILLSNI
jgi:hypothetical protein